VAHRFLCAGGSRASVNPLRERPLGWPGAAQGLHISQLHEAKTRWLRMKELATYIVLSAIMMTIWTLGARYLFPHSEVVSMTIHELNGNDGLRGT
jgi:hypothetical protein